ncbi:MAG TPA: fumarylacetoacetate hydrolase family protein [Bryobacteraceae bacterium]|jgi:2-keto-4-pentenoate hydratase/2-oxohepta-3-ene-1,7-dioic acid hydratase in catechol pathway
MKLIRFGEPGREKPGVLLENGKRIDVSAASIGDYDEAFFGGDGLSRLSAWLGSNAASAPEVSAETRLGPCVARPSKLICIGLNYAKHAKESNMDTPKEPVVFFKATSSIIGPNDTVIIPKNSRKSDWEVELAVVIGKKASYVSEADAMSHLAGYCLHNDYSEREWQLERGGQWVKGKSCDTFAPLGPFLATPDEIKDPHNLNLWLKRNNVTRQNSNTSDLIFNIPTLISYLSQFMSLLPGDVISTGTPEGVGHGCKPPEYMADGDVIELGIEGLGTSKQSIVSYR